MKLIHDKKNLSAQSQKKENFCYMHTHSDTDCNYFLGRMNLKLKRNFEIQTN